MELIFAFCFLVYFVNPCFFTPFPSVLRTLVPVPGFCYCKLIQKGHIIGSRVFRTLWLAFLAYVYKLVITYLCVVFAGIATC